MRVAISKWQKKQERRYQELSEFEDFHISVEANEGGVDGELCKVKIRCKCKESVKLQEGIVGSILCCLTGHDMC